MEPVRQQRLTIRTRGRAFHNVTQEVHTFVQASGLREGLCHVFLRHTSASLCITENADPEVLRDLERFAARIAPDGDPLFRHDDEGPDDMPAHVRTVLAGCQLSVPVADGQLLLGTWQGIYLWEHRSQGHRRELVITVVGS